MAPQLRRDNIGRWIRHERGLMAARMHTVVRPLDKPKLDALFDRLCTLGGNRVIAKKDFARGVLIDSERSLEEGAFVDFFGLPACPNLGFAKIAARSQATVILGFALWLEPEGRHVLRFYLPAEMSGDRVADTQRLQKMVEEVISS